jgi:hypothetical protein
MTPFPQTETTLVADAILVQPGSKPWQPGDGSSTKLVEVLHEYDVPLVGVVSQCGVDYVFSCLAGEAEPFSLWCYALLSDDDRERLDAASTQDELNELVDELMEPPCVLAAAGEGYGIIASRAVQARGAVEQSIQELVGAVGEWTSRVRRGAEEYASSHLCSA